MYEYKEGVGLSVPLPVILLKWIPFPIWCQQEKMHSAVHCCCITTNDDVGSRWQGMEACYSVVLTS